MCFFFFNDTATTEIYTLSLHDALPICNWGGRAAYGALRVDRCGRRRLCDARWRMPAVDQRDRKSTRLNSSHQIISYAVFCLKKKNTSYMHRILYVSTNHYKQYDQRLIV